MVIWPWVDPELLGVHVVGEPQGNLWNAVSSHDFENVIPTGNEPLEGPCPPASPPGVVDVSKVGAFFEATAVVPELDVPTNGAARPVPKT